MDRKIEKKKWPPKRIAAYSAVAIFVLFVIYVFVFQFSKSSLNVRKERITVSEVKKGAFQEFIPVIGEVMPIDTYHLDAVEGGRVEEIYLEAGSVVMQGDKIL